MTRRDGRRCFYISMCGPAVLRSVHQEQNTVLVCGNVQHSIRTVTMLYGLKWQLQVLFVHVMCTSTLSDQSINTCHRPSYSVMHR